MSQPGKFPPSMQDDRLAEFTDNALAGRLTQTEADVDKELLALEETVLRLKSAFPPVALEPSTVKQMQVRFNARAKREAREAKQPFWKKWLEPQSRLQFGMAFAAAALVIAFAIFSPAAATANLLASAAALAPMKNIFAALTLAGVILIFLWMKRRKS